MSVPLDKLKILWNDFGKICIDNNGNIEEAWHIFKKSTNREEIWHWFENKNSEFSVTKEMGLV